MRRSLPSDSAWEEPPLAYNIDMALVVAQVQVMKMPFGAPGANAHAERWLRRVLEGCLDRLILSGPSGRSARRIRYDLLSGHRSHQGVGSRASSANNAPV